MTHHRLTPSPSMRAMALPPLLTAVSHYCTTLYFSFYLWNTKSVTICLSSFMVLTRRWITPVDILHQPVGNVSFFKQINTANEDRQVVSLLAFYSYSPCHQLTLMQQFVIWLPKGSVTGFPHKGWGTSQRSDNFRMVGTPPHQQIKNAGVLV